MTRWSHRSFFIISACVWLLVPARLPAQDMGALPPAPVVKNRPEKKTTGWFSRPKARTPEEQLAWANDLLATGHKRAAARQYYALVATWHESPQAPAAQLAYAKLIEERGNDLEAFDEFQYLIDRFAGLFPFEEALDHQFRIANTVMTQRHGRFLFGGYTAPERALPLFEQIVKNGPQWKHTPQAQFHIGLIHEENKDHDKAIAAYETIQVSYPDSPEVEESRFRRARCLYTLVNAAPRHEPGYRDALSALSMFLQDYPKSDKAQTAGQYLDELKERLAAMYYERAVFYDTVARRPRSAVIAYADFIRNFPTSRLAAEAGDRMDALKLEMEKRNEK
jgi:outer membrane protein assembly factor BamD (BamD/ComL family)